MSCLSSIAPLILIMVYPHQYSCYNTNRQIVFLADNDNCEYYDNPVFPNFLQTRMKEAEPSPQLIVVENRIRKEAPYYRTETTEDQPKIVSFFPNMTPADLAELERAVLEAQYPAQTAAEQEEEEEPEPNIDYDQLWKVGEAPAPKSIQTLPDVYVKPEDAPPILDKMTMEKSELTEEAHDMENVEIEEKYLSEPLSETREVIIETVTIRPEPVSTANPALAMFKEIDLSKMKKKDVKQKSQNDDKKKIVAEAASSTLAPEKSDDH